MLFEQRAAVEHVVAVGLGMDGRTRADRHHDAHLVLLGHVEQPVHAALGLAEPLADERLAAAVAASGDPALHLERLVDDDAGLVKGARAHGARAAHAVAVKLVVLLDEDDLGAVLGGVAGAAGARVAAADDEDLGVDRLDDLVGRNGVGLDLPGVLSGKRIVLGRGGLVGERGGRTQGGHGGAAEGGALEEGAAGDVVHVRPLSSQCDSNRRCMPWRPCATDSLTLACPYPAAHQPTVNQPCYRT